MTGERLRKLPALALVAGLAGCGQGSSQHTPDLSTLPLPRAVSVATQFRECDSGANAYCALELVVVGPRFRSSNDLVSSERHQLRKHGWTGASPDTGDELADDSPGHKLRITYATAYGDLKGIDLGWIQRPREIALALSRAMFDRASAMSILLEVGAS